MANYYGNTDGTANSKFRIVCEYSYSDQNNGYYQYRYRFYIQVTTGNFYGTNITKSWGGTTSVSGAGKYGYSSYYTKNVAYGASFTLGSTAYAQYTASQTYRSQISGSAKISTAPTKTYTITYNANGGSGAPGKQTKTYGKTLKLSTTKPTRTGYTFQGWGTSATGSVVYASGANYTANASDTLYAIWKANTYTVTYNANGGSDAPATQTKTYGQTLTLSSTKPTRTNYNFLGWGTSAASTTVAYAPGADYTENSAITLYAIWSLAYVEPIIEITSLDRCTSSGTYTDDGTYAKIIFNWSTEYSVSSMKVEYKLSTSSSWISGGSISASGTSGTSQKIFGGSLDSESQYDVKITVTDSNGSSIAIKTLGAMTFEIDFLSGGGGVSIGKPANKKGFEVAYDAYFDKSVYANDRDLSTLIDTSSSQPSSQTIDSLWLKIEETLSEIKKITPYIKTSSGYDKLALSSNSVYLSNNNTLENFFLSFASPSFTTVYNVNSNLIRAVRLGNIVLMQFSISMLDTTERTLNMNGTWKPFSGFFVPLTRAGQLAANAWLSSSGNNTTLTYAAASNNYGFYTASVVYYSESDDPLIQNGDEVNY